MKTPGAHIDFEHVSVTYADGVEHVTACHDVTFSVEAGQAIALIGPSGCGKSTTLHMAAGLLAPSEGTVHVNGAPVDRPRQATAFIPQDLGLLPWKTVLGNAALGLTVRKVPKAEAIARAREALAHVNLAEFERAYPKELSGGMRQRLALARALAMDADLLLMDEPLSAIDALQRETLQDTLLELWQQRAHSQMLVTHSIEEAVYLGQRIIVFSARPGRIVADITNTGMGAPDWRDSAAFSERCHEVRQALAAATADTADLETSHDSERVDVHAEERSDKKTARANERGVAQVDAQHNAQNGPMASERNDTQTASQTHAQADSPDDKQAKGRPAPQTNAQIGRESSQQVPSQQGGVR